MENTSRRKFLKATLAATAGTMLLSPALCRIWTAKKSPFKISLAEWSLHKTLFANEMTNLDFPRFAAENGIKGSGVC
jgi:L-ribulose-5-phosphate 3-epimerase